MPLTRYLITTLINVLAVYLSVLILPGVRVDGLVALLAAALVLGLINTFVRPVLIILTLPISVVTLGSFIFILNALLVLLADWVVPGFTVSNFWWALLFSLVLAVVGGLLGLFKPRRHKK